MSSKPPYCYIELWKGKISLKVELVNLNTKDGAPKAKKNLMHQFHQSSSNSVEILHRPLPCRGHLSADG